MKNSEDTKIDLTEYGDGKIVGTIIPDNTTNEDELFNLRTKLIKQLGEENARTIWNQWGTATENYFDFLVARQLDDGKGPSMHSLIAVTDQILAFLAVRILKRLNEKSNFKDLKIRVIVDDKSPEGQHRSKNTKGIGSLKNDPRRVGKKEGKKLT